MSTNPIDKDKESSVKPEKSGSRDLVAKRSETATNQVDEALVWNNTDQKWLDKELSKVFKHHKIVNCDYCRFRVQALIKADRQDAVYAVDSGVIPHSDMIDRQALVEKIENMKTDLLHAALKDGEGYKYDEGWNEALSDVIKLLKEDDHAK